MTGVYHLTLYGLRGNGRLLFTLVSFLSWFRFEIMVHGRCSGARVGLSQEGYKLLRQVEYASMPLMVMMFGLYLGDLLGLRTGFQRYRKIWAVAASVQSFWYWLY